MLNRNSGARLSRSGALLLATTCLSAAAHAQSAPAEGNGEEAEGEAIVVSGTPIRDSLEKSLQAQRDADNVVSVIASDTIGRFPDATAAGALARLPGVAVQRDQGQERYIQIRGAPTRWTQVSVDGINVLGAEDRIFRFDSVPAVQIDQLELNKTLLPEMPADALAGRVNILTYAPLDHEGIHFSGDAGYGFVDLGDGPVNNYAARASWANDWIGISAAFSRFDFEQQTDNSEPRFDAVGITQLRITKYIIQRGAESFSGKIQIAPTTGLRLTGSYLDTKFFDNEQRNQFRFQYNNAFSGTRNFDTADLIGVPMDGLFQQGRFENGVKLAVLNGAYEGDGWKVVGDVAYARTNFDADIPLVSMSTLSSLTAANTNATTAALFPSVQLDVNAVYGGIPFSTLFDTVLVGGVPTRGAQQDAIDQRQFTRQSAAEGISFQRTESWTGKLAVEREWESLGGEAKLSFGGQYDTRRQTTDVFNQLLANGVTTGTLNLTTTAATLGLPYTPFDFITRQPWDTNFNFGYTVNYLDNPALFEQFAAIQAAAGAANAAGTGNFPVIGSDRKLFNTVEEDIAAGYVSNRWRWDRHTVVVGVRLENTRTSTTGVSTVGATLTPLAFSRSETSVFPSLHYTFDATDTVKLRAALISGQARPSLEDMRATVTINDTAGTVTGGNPFLKPEKAYGVDLSAEWYFAPASLLSVSFFHREVSDVLFDSTTPVGDDRYDTPGFATRAEYDFNSVLNGQDGRLTGVELVYNQPWTFLPGALSGFGFTGSVTFNTGSFRTPPTEDLPDGRESSFPGTSDTIISASIFYEKYGLSARLSYQTRSDWLDEVFASGSTTAGDLFWGRSTRWDASIRYQINDIFSVYADANNITDENGVRYQGVRDRPYEVESFGRRYLFGIRANF